MKRIFLDTNFVIDYFVRGEEFAVPAESLLTQCRKNGCGLYVSYLTVANFAYVLRKMPSETLANMLQRLCEAFNVISNTKAQIEKAILLGAPDFEDALQYQAALDEACDCIISRNAKDYPYSTIPVLSASEYLEKYS